MARWLARKWRPGHVVAPALIAVACGGGGPVQPGEAPFTADAVSVGSDHTCAIAPGGLLYCWGKNASGQLGDSTTTQREHPVRVTGGLRFASVRAGYDNTCGVTIDGTAFCWGGNLDGRLGDSTDTNRTTPVLVRGRLTFATVGSAFFHTCGVTTAGTAYCWGYGNVGQLGDGTVAPHSALTPVPLAGGLSFNSLSTINFHTCGVTTEGAAYCWGSNRFGGLGDGTTADAASPVAVVGGFSFASVSVGFAHTCGLTMVVGAAYCWGHNNAGQFGNGATVDVPNPVPVQRQYRFTMLSAGGDDTCGVTTSGVALCWGSGYAGELGDGTGLPRTTPTPVAGGLGFASISAGLGHTCGVTTSGALYCWGSNVHGEIGDGTTTNRSAPVSVIP